MRPIETGILTAIAVAASLAVFGVPKAASHSWYSAKCCSGKDCAKIDVKHVTISPGQYTVRLMPGDHPMVDQPMVFTFPTSDQRVKPSEDWGYHSCISQYTKRMLCFYKPDAGV